MLADVAGCALKHWVLEADSAAPEYAVHEFWVPRSHERADLAVLGDSIGGYEIKTSRDTLRRLPRQAEAFSRLFDYCHAVVAEKHLPGAREIVPTWWGLILLRENMSFERIRPASPNVNVDPEIVVRLLWRSEALDALMQRSVPVDPGATRAKLWAKLISTTTTSELRELVRGALVRRDPSEARIPTRRFRTAVSPLAAQ